MLAAINHEALTHFSNLPRIMLRTGKIAIDQSLLSHTFQYSGSALPFTSLPQTPSHTQLEPSQTKHLPRDSTFF